MPSSAQTLPVVVLVVASVFAAPALVGDLGDILSNNKADPQNPAEALIDDARAAVQEEVGNIASASVSPSAAHVATCSPDFEGAGLRVVRPFHSLKFGPSAAHAQAPVISSSFRGDYAVDWRFEQIGQSVDYIIKDVDNNDLAVSARYDSSVILDKASNAPDQIWTVQCDTCSTGISEIHGKVACRCIIAHNSVCVAVGPNPDSPASLTTSHGGCTKFDFFTN
ncbi:hypothetical protein BDZ89DRAFT_1083219 [Hymenopellis radicata]|nr:hypothetical protein BDZ89DRAFT_1083219 [Hymenopellis radicata]